LFKGLWSHRFLMVTLIRRQFHLRYRQTAVGWIWSILPPLATLAMATLVFHKVAGVEAPGNTSYGAFTLVALAPWTFFTNCLSAGVPSVVQGSQMVTKLAFPRSVIPLSMIGVSLVDLAIANGLLFAYLLITGVPIPSTIAWFPLLLLIEVLLVSGVVLLMCSLNVFARDIKLGLPLFTQLWLFLTPVLYPLSEVGDDLRNLYLLNPMTGLVASFREVILVGRPPSMELLTPSLIATGVLMLVGIWYFSSVEHRFADAL
jgi:lipopolysaccharide transport system permease protein